ncbi:EAL domain-containing protein [Acidicapsa dinghuensis]|uniref:EAL domain-containing protein n=1 Tax=Acidicapsa dinghuensis TaxID=2218256 RepID=A0ABW1EA85_9BACT|nr:EAL domain-containing protein [Acidicapsa dinghuensis]
MQISQQDVHQALERGEFVPHFQPIIRLRTGQLYGFEMLARWAHPELGLIFPGDFIEQAERDGWISELTYQLLRKGLKEIAPLPGEPTLSVNISPPQLHGTSFVDQVHEAAAEANFPLNRLILEITESALAEDIVSVSKTVQSLKIAGCRLALDDFGTGYSSLLHLQSLPFDELKVDRSFVSSMTQKHDSRQIVAAVVGLGQSLSLTTVAEGVETEEQAEILLWLGCELGQGWLYGKPVPAEQLDEMMKRRQPHASNAILNGMTGRQSATALEIPPMQRFAQLRAIYDGAPVGLAFLDREMRYLSINRRLAAINGSPMEEHLGRTVAEMIPEFFPTVRPLIERALAGEVVAGVELTKPTQNPKELRTILLSYEPAFDESGEVIGVSVVLLDITPIKRAEEAQRESEAHFRHMIELIPQIPWIIDPEGRALDVSQRWLELTGVNDDQWRGFAWLDSLHPDDRQPTIDAMHRSFQSGEPIDIYYRVRRSKDHPWQLLRSRGSARRDDNGEIMCWYGSLEIIGESDAGKK